MDMLIHHMLDTALPNRTALVDRAGAWSYGELQEHSRAVASWLAAHDVGRGDRVLVKATADKRVPALMYGCSRIGAVFVPVAEMLTPYQLSHIIADSGPVMVIDNLEATWQRITACPDATTIPAEPEPSDQVVFFYTSGSTAAQKAVMAPHRQISFVAAAIQERLGYRETDTVFCRLPLNFDYGLYQVTLSVLARATLVLADPADDARLVVELQRHGATVVPVVPALASMLVRLARRSSPVLGVRLFTNTGEDLPLATIDKLKEPFPAAAVQLMFGLTECKRVSILEPDGYLLRPGSVGRPLDGTSVTIEDADGCEVTPGVVGEIVVHGPHIADGYWRAPELTAQRFRYDETTSQRSLRTGDMGYLDEDGYLYFQGRRDQLFKHRGVRTSVVEIEAALGAIPQVGEAVIVPPQDGGPLVLYAVSTLSAPDLLQELKALIGPQKLPDVCHIVDSLPHGPNGKVDRAALHRRAPQERDT